MRKRKRDVEGIVQQFSDVVEDERAAGGAKPKVERQFLNV